MITHKLTLNLKNKGTLANKFTVVANMFGTAENNVNNVFNEFVVTTFSKEEQLDIKNKLDNHIDIVLSNDFLNENNPYLLSIRIEYVPNLTIGNCSVEEFLTNLADYLEEKTNIHCEYSSLTDLISLTNEEKELNRVYCALAYNYHELKHISEENMIMYSVRYGDTDIEEFALSIIDSVTPSEVVNTVNDNENSYAAYPYNTATHKRVFR